jgi:Leucine-rich repeat (LRR) protein
MDSQRNAFDDDMLVSVHAFVGLRTLDLSENRLTTCPKGISELVHLEIVYLQRNKLDTFPPISRAKNLKEIYLQNNLIREVISEVFAETKLNLLDLRMNKIENLALNSEDLEFLERFYLDNNEISQ